MHFFPNTANLDLRGTVCLCMCEEGTEGKQEPGCKSCLVHSSAELGLENLPTFQYAAQNRMLGSLNKSNFSNLLLICCNSIKRRLKILVIFFSTLLFYSKINK